MFLLSVKEVPWRFQLHTGVKRHSWLPSEMHWRSGHGSVKFMNHASNALKSPPSDTNFMYSVRHCWQNTMIVESNPDMKRMMSI